MKIPKEKTIRGRINFYAYKAGLMIIPNTHGNNYHIFDIKMNYYAHKYKSMKDVVRIVTDQLYMVV